MVQIDLSATDLVEVGVKVPRERLADFYAWYSRWLEDPEAELALSTTAEPLRAWDPAQDLDLAVSAWNGLSQRAQALFSTLIENPDRRYWAEQLALLNGIPHGKYGIAGSLAWPGRRMRKLGRPLPIESEHDDRGGSVYWMAPSLARLFADARRTADGG
jgi:hypothetical protein